jgi:hypothetical protein
MIAMQVRNENMINTAAFNFKVHDLNLAALATIEHNQIIAGSNNL